MSHTFCAATLPYGMVHTQPLSAKELFEDWRSRREMEIEEKHQKEIEKLSSQNKLLETQLKSSKSQITLFKRKNEESQEEMNSQLELVNNKVKDLIRELQSSRKSKKVKR